MNIYDITTKLLIGFVLLFLVTRIIGKSQIKQIKPFDFISALVMGELLGNSIYDKQVGLLFVVYTILLWGGLVYLVETISEKYPATRSFLEGNPSIVIRDGVVDRKELNKNHLTLNTLQELLRQKDVFSIRHVKYAVFEQSGGLSVLKKYKYAKPTVEDFNLPEKEVNLPALFIIDGQVMQDNLISAGFDKKWLKIQIKSAGVNKFSEVFYAEWLKDDGLFVMPYQQKKENIKNCKF